MQSKARLENKRTRMDEQRYKLSREELVGFLSRGMSSRDIERETGYTYWNVLHWIKRYGLQEQNNYAKLTYREDYFSKIDTKEKAYIIGFILGDGCVMKNGQIDISISLRDREILDFMVSEFGGRVRVSTRTDPSTKRFPKATLKIGNKSIGRDIGRLMGGRTKKERHIPRIRRDLEPYMVQGFFDAEGCITWGYRKDRGRIWQKVSFTSQYKLLIGIQDILCKNGITSAVRKKSGEACHVIEIGQPQNVMRALHYIYHDPNFVVLQRKYEKFIALRLELGEFGENLHGQYRAKPAEREGVETSGGVATHLNDRKSAQAPTGVRDSPTLAETQANKLWGQICVSSMFTTPTFWTSSTRNLTTRER